MTNNKARGGDIRSDLRLTYYQSGGYSAEPRTSVCVGSGNSEREALLDLLDKLDTLKMRLEEHLLFGEESTNKEDAK
jgi:hypothetical protein